MTTLSIGKLRSLQQCATPRGALAILALDHRNNLRHALRPDAPDTVRAAELTSFKQDVVGALAPAASAVLLDPEVGAAQCIAAGALPGSTGLAVAVEATGYTGDPGARVSRVSPGWSVAKTRRMGANAAKLLVYYHPDAPTAAEIETLVRQVAADCAAQDLPLMLEPLSYSPDPTHKKLSPEERRRVVLESARRLVVPGVDILKAEFPLDVSAEPDQEHWAEACAELTAASAAPWVLLSASVDYETYLRQVTVACQAGASGVAVGRAVWKEATSLTGEARTAFLRGPARERMSRITALCDALARPWTDIFGAPEVDATWYQNYSPNGN
ncbi:MAG TPA: tagatose 1,6-diphosphate aldolase [Anaerolineae bacterium]|nr:tagatose 1,6-diphosphate aldolase [Anaerolineae bacterium]